jgi:hypothetical protein
MILENNTRRVFYINVENLSKSEVQQYVAKIQRMISGKRIYKVKEWKKINPFKSTF